MRAGRALASAAILALGAAVPLATDPNALQERQAEVAASCSSLHIIVARGSYEAPGEGCIGDVASMICDQVADCDSLGIVYPATMETDADYVSSEGQGTVAMLAAAKSYHRECSKTPIVLMGYSQGAQVVTDTICGHHEPGWADTDPINGTVTNRIIAVIQMGDPSHVVGLPYDVGTATNNGTVFRKDTDACAPFADRIQTYCDEGDPYCASGDNITVHHSYMPEYGPAAASFVVAQYASYTASTSAKAAKHKSTSVASVSTTVSSVSTTAATATVTAS